MHQSPWRLLPLPRPFFLCSGGDQRAPDRVCGVVRKVQIGSIRKGDGAASSAEGVERRGEGSISRQLADRARNFFLLTHHDRHLRHNGHTHFAILLPCPAPLFPGGSPERLSRRLVPSARVHCSGVCRDEEGQQGSGRMKTLHPHIHPSIESQALSFSTKPDLGVDNDNNDERC